MLNTVPSSYSGRYPWTDKLLIDPMMSQIAAHYYAFVLNRESHLNKMSLNHVA